MEILMLSADDVRAVTTMPRAIAAMRRGMEALFRGDIDAPLRTPIHQPDGVSFFMPAASRASVGIKIVSVFGNNPTNSLPVINGVYVLVDHDTGVPVAVMDATYMTALRTGATTGLATDLLAPPEASVLTIFGAGGQAQSLIDGVRAVRPIEEIRVVSKGGASAQRLAAQQAIGGDDAGGPVGSCVIDDQQMVAHPIEVIDVAPRLAALGGGIGAHLLEEDAVAQRLGGVDFRR